MTSVIFGSDVSVPKLFMNVPKVDLFGLQGRAIEVKIDPSRLSQSKLSIADIAQAFARQNNIVDAGAIETDRNRLRIEAAGSFTSLDEIRNLTVVSRDGVFFRLGEIADISETYVKPARISSRKTN